MGKWAWQATATIGLLLSSINGFAGESVGSGRGGGTRSTGTPAETGFVDNTPALTEAHRLSTERCGPYTAYRQLVSRSQPVSTSVVRVDQVSATARASGQGVFTATPVANGFEIRVVDDGLLQASRVSCDQATQDSLALQRVRTALELGGVSCGVLRVAFSSDDEGQDRASLRRILGSFDRTIAHVEANPAIYQNFNGRGAEGARAAIAQLRESRRQFETTLVVERRGQANDTEANLSALENLADSLRTLMHHISPGAMDDPAGLCQAVADYDPNRRQVAAAPAPPP
ncbi:MAG: hypothetical protein V4760_19695 [Bdellovibrionota bacterium]